MAMTETRPAAAAGSGAHAADAALPAPAGGLAGILGSGDHRVLGRLWIGTAVVFLVGTGVLGTLLSVERLDTARYDVFSSSVFQQVFSIHAVGSIFLFALPLLVGVALVVVPAQIGARSVAFPRAAALSYWGFLVGAALLLTSYLIDGGPGGANQRGVDLFIAALGLVALSIVVASISLGTTVLALRAPGMSLDRVPAFTWSILVAAGIWITSLGFLVGELVLLYLDSRYRVGAFSPQAGLDRWLYWTVTQPQIYAIAIPVLGFAVDAVATLAGHRTKRHGVVLGAIGLFGGLSFGAWTFTAPQHAQTYRQVLFIAVSFGALLPVLVILGGVGEAIARGRLRLASPALFGIAALLMLGTGVAVGALRAIEAFDLVGTTADSSAAHYVLGAAAIAGVGALHYWWPQILRQPLKEALGRTTALLALVGTVGLALPDVISGILDEPRGSLGAVDDAVKVLNVLSLLGGVLLALAVVVLAVNLATSLSGRAGEVEADPWDGLTLEWAADPAMIPVSSAAPLLDQKEAEGSR